MQNFAWMAAGEAAKRLQAMRGLGIRHFPPFSGNADDLVLLEKQAVLVYGPFSYDIQLFTDTRRESLVFSTTSDSESVTFRAIINFQATAPYIDSKSTVRLLIRDIGAVFLGQLAELTFSQIRMIWKNSNASLAELLSPESIEVVKLDASERIDYGQLKASLEINLAFAQVIREAGRPLLSADSTNIIQIDYSENEYSNRRSPPRPPTPDPPEPRPSLFDRSATVKITDGNTTASSGRPRIKKGSSARTAPLAGAKRTAPNLIPRADTPAKIIHKYNDDDEDDDETDKSGDGSVDANMADEDVSPPSALASNFDDFEDEEPLLRRRSSTNRTILYSNRDTHAGYMEPMIDSLATAADHLNATDSPPIRYRTDFESCSINGANSTIFEVEIRANLFKMCTDKQNILLDWDQFEVQPAENPAVLVFRVFRDSVKEIKLTFTSPSMATNMLERIYTSQFS